MRWKDDCFIAEIETVIFLTMVECVGCPDRGRKREEEKVAGFWRRRRIT